MSTVFVTGDKHGTEGIYDDLGPERFPAGTVLTKQDYVVILGDFGVLWNNPTNAKEKECLKFLSGCPWTTLVVDGNHENFELLDRLPSVEWGGAPAGVIAKDVYHLRRGNIYTINGKKCFVFGGGASTDKEYRLPGVSWWSREIASREETERGFDSLSAAGWRVDYMFSHVAPMRAVDGLMEKYFPQSRSWGWNPFSDPVSEYLDILAGKTEFSKWFFGHYHFETSLFSARASGMFQCLYDSIERLS